VSLFRHRRSFILPLVVTVVIPFFLTARFHPFNLKINLRQPLLQLVAGLLLLCLGLALLVSTIRMFASTGKGTLAPWDPTQQLVVQGVYAHTRNPMISGVLFILVGEAILSGSSAIWIWALLFFAINTIYFKLLEEPGLARRFGQEYLTYRLNVPMWIPRLKPWCPDREAGKHQIGKTHP
jgi:protein-S-isoprenylcysteine O-methyltransferase Ste14